MIETNNLTKFKIDEKSFSQVAKKVLSGENRGTRARNNLRSNLGGESFSLAFISKPEMQKLNKKYRGKDKPTDVLAFAQISNFRLIPQNYGERSRAVPFPISNSFGEIIICPSVVLENSEKYKTDFNKEILRVFIHGILHLLGYDHEKSEKQAKEMEEKEKFYLCKI